MNEEMKEQTKKRMNEWNIKYSIAESMTNRDACEDKYR